MKLLSNSIPRRETVIPRREIAIPRRGMAVSRRGIDLLIVFSRFI